MQIWRLNKKKVGWTEGQSQSTNIAKNSRRYYITIILISKLRSKIIKIITKWTRDPWKLNEGGKKFGIAEIENCWDRKR